MLKNYLKIAWRNLVKNKTFSIINILGLAIGLCCFLLIALWVMDELSFDNYNKKADRIYRINSDIRFGGSDLKLPVSSDMMGQVLKKDYPQVEQYTRMYAQGGLLVKKDGQYISEQNLVWADSTLFDVFTLPALSGDTKTALNEPNAVVITESTAKKYFNTVDAIGKVLETNDEGGTNYKVTAVIKNIPHNSHFHLNMIFSMDNVKYNWGNFLSHNFFTYLVLKENVNYKEFEKNFKQYIDKYVMPQAAQYMQIKTIDEFEKAGNKVVYSLTPLRQIHFQSDRNFDLSPPGSLQYVYIFSAVALFILLIACINFMNLTTARSSNRAREVGIRKVLGTGRKNLMTQFLTESTLMVFISLIIAIGLATAVLPLFNNISTKSMAMGNLFSPIILPLLIALPFAVGLIAGSYPAFYLSAFKPILVLKGNLSGKKRGGLRSSLVVFQFAISIILIIGTIIIYGQLNYIQHKNLGFNKDQVLIINNAYTLRKNADAYKTEMLRQAGVINGTLTGFLPVNSSRNDYGLSPEPVMTAKNGVDMQVWEVDENYINTMGMQIKNGRNFSPEFKTDSSAILLNESAVKIFGFGNNPVEKKLYYKDDQNNKLAVLNVIGTVKDFHFATLRENIGPLGLRLGHNITNVSFKVAAANIPAILKTAEEKWKELAPGMPFSYQFMNEAFDAMYRSEQRVGKIALIFSVLAIFIACLGLFGLATFIAEQRTKEIGIRKVLGASVRVIVQLLSKDFLKLVIIAFVVAVPVSWYFMHKWLQDFAYRITINWWVFLIAGIAAMLIAVFTISFQAVRAALNNPVNNLRTE
jgi:putative ABC transport system permease protein